MKELIIKIRKNYGKEIKRRATAFAVGFTLFFVTATVIIGWTVPFVPFWVLILNFIVSVVSATIQFTALSFVPFLTKNFIPAIDFTWNKIEKIKKILKPIPKE